MSDVEAGTAGTQSWDERNIWRAGLAARTAWLLAFVALFALVPMLADKWVYDHVWMDRVYDKDWARLLRQMGWYPTWVLAALAVLLAQRRPDGFVAPSPPGSAAHRNARLLLFAPALAGIVCEILKLTIRRERPHPNAGEWVFRAWDDQTWSTAGLGMPSSHTMVAFGAATALARIFPGARIVWYGLATGCAITRVLDRAHFFSDITLGALLGWSIGWGVWIALRRSAAPSALA